MKKQKRTRRVNKKIVLIITGVLVLLGAAAGGYWLYTQQQKKQQQQAIAKQQQHDKIEQKFVDEAFRGNRELAADFMMQINQNNHEAATKVYTDAIAATDDPIEKISLYKQYSLVANTSDLPDHSLKAALGADKLQSSYITLFRIADAYNRLGDTANEITYLKKAIAAYDALPDDDNTQAMMEIYRSQLADAQEKQ